MNERQQLAALKLVAALLGAGDIDPLGMLLALAVLMAIVVASYLIGALAAWRNDVEVERRIRERETEDLEPWPPAGE